MAAKRLPGSRRKKPVRTAHTVKNVGEYFTDQYRCACGWLSDRYYDLPEACLDAWLLHLDEVNAPPPAEFIDRQARLVAERQQHLQSLYDNRRAIDQQIAAVRPKR